MGVNHSITQFGRYISYFRAAMGIQHGNRAFGGPIQGELGLTNRCNLSCIHCYYHSKYLDRPSLRPVREARLAGSELPSHDVLKEIQKIEADSTALNALIDNLIEMGARRFQFSGCGETFLHRNAMDFMARAKHAGCICWALTSGHMFNKEKIDALIDMGFDELRITVMAGTHDMYLRTHPGIEKSAFRNLSENLLYLAERKRTLRKKKPILNLFYVVVSENYDGLMEFAEFADQVQADGVQYRPFDAVGDPGLARLILTADQSASVLMQLKVVQPYLEAKGINHNVNEFLNAFKGKLDTSGIYQIIPCYYFWLVVRIEPDGVLFPCCRCSTSPGNVYKEDFRSIWYGKNYRRLRHEAFTINKRQTPVAGCSCNSCVNYTANLRVHRYFHPIDGRSEQIRKLSPITVPKNSMG